MSEKTVRVLFVCHGNICRSTMAQCVMQWLVDEAGLGAAFTIDSAATTNEEIGRLAISLRPRACPWCRTARGASWLASKTAGTTSS